MAFVVGLRSRPAQILLGMPVEFCFASVAAEVVNRAIVFAPKCSLRILDFHAAYYARFHLWFSFSIVDHRLRAYSLEYKAGGTPAHFKLFFQSHQKVYRCANMKRHNNYATHERAAAVSCYGWKMIK